MAQSKPKSSSKQSGNSMVGTKRAPTKAGRSSGSTLTWAIVGVVLVVVIGLVVYAVTSGNSGSNSGGHGYQPASGTLVQEVTHIPASVYDAVGVTSSVAPVSPPVATSGEAPLTFTSASGAQVPGVFYLGSEYCPYCAAQRWAVIAALSRFGTISGLGITESSSKDVYPNTPSFTFYKASFDMTGFAVQAVEQYSNIPTSDGQSYTELTKLTKAQQALAQKFDSSKYFPSGAGGIPFIDMGNQFLVSGAMYSPSIINSMSRDDIAAGLSNPNNPATQAIVASANYLTASICKLTQGQPGSVCTSKGVQAAASAMKISF
jgi:Domain of unknown function (DUF929)